MEYGRVDLTHNFREYGNAYVGRRSCNRLSISTQYRILHPLASAVAAPYMRLWRFRIPDACTHNSRTCIRAGDLRAFARGRKKGAGGAWPWETIHTVGEMYDRLGVGWGKAESSGSRPTRAWIRNLDLREIELFETSSREPGLVVSAPPAPAPNKMGTTTFSSIPFLHPSRLYKHNHQPCMSGR